MVDPHEKASNRRIDEDEKVTLPNARVRDEDLEPHDGLRYIAKLFKALSILLIFMLAAEVVLGLRAAGMNGLGALLIDATRLIVFAGFLWAAGDLAIMFIESNHDLRAARILLGRLNGKLDGTVVSQHRSGPPAV